MKKHIDTSSTAPSQPRGKQPPWCDYADGGMIGEVPDRGAAPSTPGGGSGEDEDEEVVYFIGVIDILTDWTCAKSAENIFKTMTHPWKHEAHSCVPPIRYADRFERALQGRHKELVAWVARDGKKWEGKDCA